MFPSWFWAALHGLVSSPLRLSNRCGRNIQSHPRRLPLNHFSLLFLPPESLPILTRHHYRERPERASPASALAMHGCLTRPRGPAPTSPARLTRDAAGRQRGPLLPELSAMVRKKRSAATHQQCPLQHASSSPSMGGGRSPAPDPLYVGR